MYKSTFLVKSYGVKTLVFTKKISAILQIHQKHRKTITVNYTEK